MHYISIRIDFFPLYTEYGSRWVFVFSSSFSLFSPFFSCVFFICSYPQFQLYSGEFPMTALIFLLWCIYETRRCEKTLHKYNVRLSCSFVFTPLFLLKKQENSAIKSLFKLFTVCWCRFRFLQEKNEKSVNGEDVTEV